MDLDKILSAAKSEGGTQCVICDYRISPGEKVIAAEVKIGSSFIAALQKTVRKETHVKCAAAASELIGKKIAQAEGL